MYEKIIVVTRRTRLQELIAKFNTRGQAKFYIEHSGGDFADYQREDDNYRRSIEIVQNQIGNTLKAQFVDRDFLPNFIFSEKDIVVALGQDGLVANAAKYVGSQPIIGVNPDPERFDGILVPMSATQLQQAIKSVITNTASVKSVSLAEAVLNDGQKLLAFNDLFIGARTHISARYRLELNGCSELQSSSGLIVATGAGSTGWLSSIFNMVSSINAFTRSGEKHTDTSAKKITQKTKDSGAGAKWASAQLCFVVREPFISRQSTAKMVIGMLTAEQELVIESRMPSGGTIFSDGVESDFLSFDSGMTARIRAAKQCVKLIQPIKVPTGATIDSKTRN